MNPIPIEYTATFIVIYMLIGTVIIGLLYRLNPKMHEDNRAFFLSACWPLIIFVAALFCVFEAFNWVWEICAGDQS